MLYRYLKIFLAKKQRWSRQKEQQKEQRSAKNHGTLLRPDARALTNQIHYTYIPLIL
jgi:hypothetical protein